MSRKSYEQSRMTPWGTHAEAYRKRHQPAPACEGPIHLTGAAIRRREWGVDRPVVFQCFRCMNIVGVVKSGVLFDIPIPINQFAEAAPCPS